MDNKEGQEAVITLLHYTAEARVLE